jgi:HK97 gp10 family phage protein
LSVDTNFNDIKKACDSVASEFVSNVDSELNRIGDLMVKYASDAAPRDTGYMADNIEKSSTGFGSVTVTAIAPYSGFVDQGTIKMDAQPFFSDNVEKIKKEEIPIIEQNLNAKIDALFKVIRNR